MKVTALVVYTMYLALLLVVLFGEYMLGVLMTLENGSKVLMSILRSPTDTSSESFLLTFPSALLLPAVLSSASVS